MAWGLVWGFRGFRGFGFSRGQTPILSEEQWMSSPWPRIFQTSAILLPLLLPSVFRSFLGLRFPFSGRCERFLVRFGGSSGTSFLLRFAWFLVLSSFFSPLSLVSLVFLFLCLFALPLVGWSVALVVSALGGASHSHAFGGISGHLPAGVREPSRQRDQQASQRDQGARETKAATRRGRNRRGLGVPK